ncbi:hypothetical protein R84981_000620 [Carnimonas sp. R-84981]|uniref:HigA family addiction module antitoxin n=1 Tax=Carnimonas bestiolae TaxID=3402172 RepID=UPI003EDCB21C
MKTMHNPPHPGLVVSEYIKGLTVSEAAKYFGITKLSLTRILDGKASISAHLSLRLAKALGTEPELWLLLQNGYDLWQASQHPPEGVTVIPRVR